MKLFAPAGSTEISVRGMTIAVGSDGSVEVPHEVAQDLLSCGCSMEALGTPLTKKQKAAIAEEAAKRQADYTDAVAVRDAARATLFDLEGRGDNEATEKASNDLVAAESLVLELGEKL